MVKKLKSVAKNEEKQSVRNSAQQIWKAGLTAFAKAQEEGGRVLNKLVTEGSSLQQRTKKMAEDKMSEVSGSVNKVADGVSKQASGSWDKLEQVFEDRVARALGTIGVPTQKDIQALTKRVEQLAKAVAELSGKKPAAPAAAPKAVKPAAKKAAKPAAKKAAAKPAAKKTAAKPAAKAAAKPAAKPAAKKATKPAAKKAPKPAAPKAVAAPMVETPAAPADAA